MTSRTVRFYKLLDESELPFGETLPFSDLLAQVRGMSDDECYVKLSRMEVLGTSYEPRVGKNPAVPLLIVDKITRDVTLRIERRRNHRPLELAKDETLAEPTYFSVFEDNVIGVMRNSGTAPGPAAFRDYLNAARFLGETKVSIAPLADSNALARMRDVDTVSRVHLKVAPDVGQDVVGGNTSLWGIIQGTRQQAGHVGIEVILRFDQSSQEAADTIKDELVTLDQDQRVELMDKAVIAYRRIEDGKADVYDFLREAVAHSVDIDLDDSDHAPTERSAAEGMAKAYDQLYDEIRRANQHF